METNLNERTLLQDEYTQKALDLYAKLKIDSDKVLTLEQLSHEYEQCQKTLSNDNVLCSNFYLCR